MLEVEDIHTYYGDSYVLQGISLKVGPGQVVAVLGRNGAGKTTLIHSVIGFTPCQRGRVMFKGTDIARMPPHRIARLGIGIVPQGRRVFASLTVRENLEIAARGRREGGQNKRHWNLDEVCETFPPLRNVMTQRAGTLSGGEQQMLAISRALVGNPDLLLMDEPSEGLAPLIVWHLREMLQSFTQHEISILLVEQNFAFATSLADNVYVMNRGKIVYESSPDALWANDDVKARYLGV